MAMISTLLNDIFYYCDYIGSLLFNICQLEYGKVLDCLFNEIPFEFSTFMGGVDQFVINYNGWLLEIISTVFREVFDILFNPIIDFGYISTSSVPFILCFFGFVLRGTVIIAFVNLFSKIT